MKARELAGRFYRALNDHTVTDTAAELSYYLLFSLFSLLFFLVTLTAYLPLRDAVESALAQLSQVLPSQAMGPIEQQVKDLLSKPKPKLLTLGLLVSLWTASRSLDAFRKGLNLAYDVKESRPWWRTQLMTVGLTVAESLLVLTSFGLLALGGAAGTWLGSRIGIERTFVSAWSWLRWPATALIVMLVAALAYYLLPDVEQRFRYISPGSVTSSVLWLFASFSFSEYVNHIGRYSVTYGSVGAAVILLTWMYISGLLFLAGGELNAVIEHASPEGKRAGARMPGAAPPPPEERPSASPPAAVKLASRGVTRPPSASREGHPPPEGPT
jgi:membrane protein